MSNPSTDGLTTSSLETLLRLALGWELIEHRSARAFCGSPEAEKNQSSDFIHFQRRFFSLTIFRISVIDSKSVSIFCDFLRFLCAKRHVSAPNRALGDASAPPSVSGPPLSITLISSDSKCPTGPNPTPASKPGSSLSPTTAPAFRAGKSSPDFGPSRASFRPLSAPRHRRIASAPGLRPHRRRRPRPRPGRQLQSPRTHSARESAPRAQSHPSPSNTRVQN